ncbi:MAG TPA: hypothetical protein P5269_02295 [Syntrophales bacterium]|nr:hypothetical protein [Syntrophales bacterium]HRS86442.1 hypothetical protein [Syntrophales bacterium]HRV42053.1 hypothetical protein [Syntrophales bacterium]
MAAVGALSLYFLFLGINQLLAAYALNHPQLFLLHFFSSSFVILISLVGIACPIFQILALLKARRAEAAGKQS